MFTGCKDIVVAETFCLDSRTVRNFWHKFLGALAGLVLSGTVASAQLFVGISNIDQGTENEPQIDGSQSLGVGFTTGAGGWMLLSVKLFAYSIAEFPPDANLSVSLYSVASGLPHTKIADLTGPNPTTVEEACTFTPVFPTYLQQFTSYYLVASSPSLDGFYMWASTGSTQVTGYSDWGLVTGLASEHHGNWVLHPDLQTPRMEVSVLTVAIPEPSTVALTGLGVAGAFFRRRRR